jgi:hypothetical protein
MQQIAALKAEGIDFGIVGSIRRSLHGTLVAA